MHVRVGLALDFMSNLVEVDVEFLDALVVLVFPCKQSKVYKAYKPYKPYINPINPIYKPF